MQTIYEIRINDELLEVWETFQDAFDRCMALDIPFEEKDILSIVPVEIPEVE